MLCGPNAAPPSSRLSHMELSASVGGRSTPSSTSSTPVSTAPSKRLKSEVSITRVEDEPPEGGDVDGTFVGVGRGPMAWVGVGIAPDGVGVGAPVGALGSTVGGIRGVAVGTGRVGWGRGVGVSKPGSSGSAPGVLSGRTMIVAVIPGMGRTRTGVGVGVGRVNTLPRVAAGVGRDPVSGVRATSDGWLVAVSPTCTESSVAVGRISVTGAAVAVSGSTVPSASSSHATSTSALSARATQTKGLINRFLGVKLESVRAQSVRDRGSTTALLPSQETVVGFRPLMPTWHKTAFD